jgi:hypothetical protein
MTEIKENITFLQVPLRYLKNVVAELYFLTWYHEFFSLPLPSRACRRPTSIQGHSSTPPTLPMVDDDADCSH